MKKAVLFFVFLLLIPTAFADITIQTDQIIYNLGNKIKVSASAMQSDDFEGLFKLTVSCDDYRLQYFTTPISLEANSRTALQVPELTASSSMLGKCALIGDLTTNDNLPIEQRTSNPFEVTYNLVILPVNEKIISLPGEEIKIMGVVNEAHGNNVLKANVKVEIDDNSYPSEAIGGKFNLTITLSKNIKSGRHEIVITAADMKNNMGKTATELEITAIPSYIKTILDKDSIDPGSRIEIIPSLYDQADELINTTLELELVSPSKEKVFRKTMASNGKIDYEFSQYAEPGLYVLTTTFKNIAATSLINVSSVRNVKIKYENESVFVENTGNVPFIEELTFLLQNELKKYAITKKISIEPGKLLMIDLSKEVPEGIYNVVLPVSEAISAVKDKINESIANAQTSEGLLANDVQIHDNRPAYRKIASGLGSISANLVGADGVLTKNPLVAPGILAAIVLLLVFRYGRKPIMNMMKGKKKDEDKK